MKLGSIIQQAKQELAILGKIAYLLLDNIEGRGSSEVLYHHCRFASRHGEGAVP